MKRSTVDMILHIVVIAMFVFITFCQYQMLVRSSNRIQMLEQKVFGK